ncbi:MAG: hypothetical protein JWP12_1293 [Bacteroidetes bacterium]|nr:hypothetical protein [Bacteroidota bacterium]
MLTPYAFAENDVIRCIDMDGLEKVKIVDQDKANFGLRMALWILNCTDIWRQFQKDIKDPQINPQKMDVYIASFRPVDANNKYSPLKINPDGTVDEGLEGQTDFVTEANALDYGIWNIGENQKAIVMVINNDIFKFITKNIFTNTKAAVNAMKVGANSIWHEAKAHVLDDMLGNKHSTLEDHQKFFGDKVKLVGVYSPRDEDIDINGDNPASVGKKQIENAGKKIEKTIENIKQKNK